MFPSLSVIIPTYNRADILQKNLQAISAQQQVDFAQMEVIVVDDGGTDDTAQMIARIKPELPFSLTFLQQPNQGQGNARNLALKHVRHGVVLILGDDMIPAPDCLAHHLAFHAKYPAAEAACLGFATWHAELTVSPFMYFLEHGGPQFAYGRLAKKPMIDTELGLRKADFWYFYTGNISLKRTLLGTDPFEPVYTSYGWEDIDLGYRLTKEQGLQLYYQPKAAVGHWHIITDEKFRQRMESIGKNARIFQTRYPEVPVIPQGLKRWIFMGLSQTWVIAIFRIFRQKLAIAQWLYYYALSKKYFLDGLNAV